jgi:hypothetical protein
VPPTISFGPHPWTNCNAGDGQCTSLERL